MDPLTRLTEYFKRFPGIGPRQAKRFSYFLLRQSQDNLERLCNDILSLKNSVKQCSDCYVYFSNSGSTTLCEDCRSETTNKTQLLVVEKDADMESIKHSGVYGGVYFVLGGTIPILEKNPVEKVRLRELLRRIQTDKGGKKVGEVILALSVNPEGENTARILREAIAHVPEFKDVKVSTLGRGLSTGTELEYSDTDTIASALKNRF